VLILDTGLAIQLLHFAARWRETLIPRHIGHVVFHFVSTAFRTGLTVRITAQNIRERRAPRD
jgi:hypothetical protein